MDFTFLYFLSIVLLLGFLAWCAQKAFVAWTTYMNKKMDLEMKKIHEKSVSDYRERRDYH